MTDEAVLPELSIVMPCLNEVETVGRCIEKAQRSLVELRIAGEIIIADNGSSDGSDAVAASQGARVVRVENRGYGNAAAASRRPALAVSLSRVLLMLVELATVPWLESMDRR